MWRHHACQYLPRIPLKHTQAVHPAAIELDQVANIREPQVMAVRRAIGEMFEADGLGLLLSGTLPGPGAPWNWRLMAIARPTVRSLGAASHAAAPVTMETKPAGAGIRLLKV